MAIQAADLRWYCSERMHDESDGGGQMSGAEILFGSENRIFDDLSDVDRAAGDVSIRKVYAAVADDSDDKYLDAGVVVLRAPTDPDVSVLAFSTGDYYDERSALRERLESGISRGAVYQGYLWGTHIAGQRAITLWQRLSANLPAVSSRLELVALSGTTVLHSQVLWVTRVVSEPVERIDAQGTYQVRSVVCELAEPLRDSYSGVEPARTDPSSPQAKVYETRYSPEAVPLVGIRPLVEAAALGDYSVKVDSLYAPLIPTALSETALADTTPGASTATLVQARASGTVNWSTTTQCVKPGVSLYLGGPLTPGTLSIGVSGSTITDSGGRAMLSGEQIGSVDYSNGVVLWADSCPNYGANSKSVTYTPAALPLRVGDTAAQAVTAENRGYVWVLTLSPIPAPGSLRVAYRANDAWYVLTDRGDGALAGSDSSYGSGSINFSTGTVTITTGAIPDADSEILYAWGVPIGYTKRGGSAVASPKVRGQTANPGVAPGSMTISWGSYSLTDNGLGALAGTGGSGAVRYSTGEWEITPTTLPAVGTELAVTYGWGDPTVETFASPARDGNGDVPLTLAAAPQAGSLELEWDLEVSDLPTQWDTVETYVTNLKYLGWETIGAL
jgi:hypothetical protein